jgi:hypothetical protein
LEITWIQAPAFLPGDWRVKCGAAWSVTFRARDGDAVAGYGPRDLLIDPEGPEY